MPAVPLQPEAPATAAPFHASGWRGATSAGVPEAVRHAWRVVIGGDGHGGLTLAQAGCNSLRLLQFALVLERALHRTIPLDLLDTTMRADDIVAALSRPVWAALPAGPRPVVFLMPGLDDDEQRLARFRVALQDDVRFTVVTYPDWPEMMRPGWGFSDLIEAVVAQVVNGSAGVPALLTGYSFGGEVAFAVACRLRATGHPVGWLGVLDTDITRVPPPPGGGPIARLRRYARELADDVAQEGPHKSAGLLLAKLARQVVGLPRMHRIAWLLPKVLPARTEFWFHRRLRSIARVKAIWAWMNADMKRRLPVPVTLFRSEFGLGPSPLDFGWAARCPQLSIVKVPGDHHTLFDSPNREVLCAAYAAVVRQISDGCSRDRNGGDASGAMHPASADGSTASEIVE